MPALRQAQMIDSQKQRLLNDPEHEFIFIWNQLVSRSTSYMEDVHGILANTLDLKANDVLALAPQDRMKAILGAREKLPVALIYNRSLKIEDADARWVPFYPEQSRLSDTYGFLEATPHGFLLDREEVNPVGFLVDPTIPRGTNIQLLCPQKSDPLWIDFYPESNGRPVNWKAPVDALAVCYVIGNLEDPLKAPALTHRYAGARFALRKKEGGTLHLVYEYSFLFGYHRPPYLSAEYQTVHGNMTDADAVFHVDCGKLKTILETW
ncbi:MAG: hypothetical protein Q9174_007421, partial [Haloplaca sp. 1 TL-2023]